MGSYGPWRRLDIIDKLRTDPESLAWTARRQVSICRHPTEGSLGLRIRTFGSEQCSNKQVTNTVVLKIYDGCIIRSGDLKPTDRILAINGTQVCDKLETEVNEIFKENRQESSIVLEVESESHLYKNADSNTEVSVSSGGDYCATGPLTQTPKRMLSRNSSGKTSMSSVEPPSPVAPNKRRFNSSGTHRDNHKQTPASSSSHPLAPNHNQVNGFVESVENRFHSLPDNISSTQIVFEIGDEGGALSLPPLNSRIFQQGCDNGLGPVETCDQDRLNITPCTNRYCDLSKDPPVCDWHHLILKVPQFVVWNSRSITVTMNKGENAEFGFKTKVKCQRGTNDINVLVCEIDPQSIAASSCLSVGDWIQSVNNHALQVREDAPVRFDKFKEVRLIIQRPEAMQLKAASQLEKIQKARRNQPRSMAPLQIRHNSPGNQVFQQSPEVAASLINMNSQPHYLYHPSSPVSVQHSGLHHDYPVSRGQRTPNIRPCQRQVPMSPSLAVSPNSPQPMSFEGHPRSFQVQSPMSPNFPPVPFPNSTQPPDCNCSPVFNTPPSNWPWEAYPPVRLIICGNAADELSTMIYKSESSKQPVHLERFSLKRADNRFMTGSFSLSSDVHCTGEPHVNVELFVIKDENFFHHCSQYLFTESSIFMVAFDAQKVLDNMLADIKRLEKLIHTVKSHVGSSCRLEVYGLRSVSPADDKDDEVRTMFYANHAGSGKYSVSIPEILFISSSNMDDAVCELHETIYKQFRHNCQFSYSPIPSGTSSVAKALSQLDQSSHMVWRPEEIKQVVYSKYPRCKDLSMQPVVVEHLQKIGTIVKIKAERGHRALNQDSFVHPVSLFNKLVQVWEVLKNSSDDDTMFKLHSSGILPFRCFLESARACLEMHEVDSFIGVLQTLGIIYDIGFLDGSKEKSLIVPYFLEDILSRRAESGGNSLVLLAVFKTAVPWTVYYRLVSELARRQECQHATLPRGGECLIKMNNFILRILMEKTADKIVIMIEKEGSCGREAVILQLFQRLLQGIVPSNLHYELGPPCPLEEGQSHTAGHVIDMATSVLKCGETGLKSHPSIKKWIIPSNTWNEGVSQQDTDRRLNQMGRHLPYHVVHNLCKTLNVPSDRDWKFLAGAMGKNWEEVEQYDSMKTPETLPCELLLKDWFVQKDSTLKRLLELVREIGNESALEDMVKDLNIDIEAVLPASDEGEREHGQ